MPNLAVFSISPKKTADSCRTTACQARQSSAPPDTVLRTLEAYQRAGVETFILSGMPLLEEAYRFGEKVCRVSTSATEC